MKIKQKILILALMFFGGAAPVVLGPPANAATCGGVETAIIECAQPGGKTQNAKDSAVWGVLLLALNILTAGVGIAAVGGIVYAAIMYTSAADNAAQTKQAIEIIRNVVLGIIAYGGMYLILNFLIPGGIFG